MTVTKAANLASKWKVDVKDTAPRRSVEPIGYSPGGQLVIQTTAVGSGEGPSRDVQQQKLVEKRAWEMALGPLKSLPMNLFMMYMAGNSISIFPIMMVCMMAWRPLKALTATNSTFKGLENELDSLFLLKLVYALGNLCCVGLALYKCQSMGLLPTHASDWLDFAQEPVQVEFSSAAATSL